MAITWCVLFVVPWLLALFCYMRNFAVWVAFGLISSGVLVRAGTTKPSLLFMKQGLPFVRNTPLFPLEREAVVMLPKVPAIEQDDVDGKESGTKVGEQKADRGQRSPKAPATPTCIRNQHLMGMQRGRDSPTLAGRGSVGNSSML